MLQPIMTDQTTDGRVMKLRGRILNVLPEPVKGARMIMRIYSADGARELAALQKELGSSIASGDSAIFRWDVESMYLGSSPVRFGIEVYPKRVGERDVPPPPGWK